MPEYNKMLIGVADFLDDFNVQTELAKDVLTISFTFPYPSTLWYACCFDDVLFPDDKIAQTQMATINATSDCEQPENLSKEQTYTEYFEAVPPGGYFFELNSMKEIKPNTYKNKFPKHSLYTVYVVTLVAEDASKVHHRPSGSLLQNQKRDLEKTNNENNSNNNNNNNLAKNNNKKQKINK